MKKLLTFMVLLAVMISLSACTLTVDSDQPVELNINQETSSDDSTQTEDSSNQSVDETLPETKTYNGDGFSFQYPADWIEAEGSLWVQERYDEYLKMVERQKTDPGNFIALTQISINVNNFGGGSMGEFLNRLYTLEVNSYEDFLVKENGEKLSDGLYFQEKTIGDYNFIKADQGEATSTQSYFVQNGQQIVQFYNFYTLTEEEFENILATLKFD